MKSALLICSLLCLVAFTSAHCPNLCSGHGTCGANDKCTCHTQLGTADATRAAWTGCDCSLRTCPVGASWGETPTFNVMLGAPVHELYNGASNFTMKGSESAASVGLKQGDPIATYEPSTGVWQSFLIGQEVMVEAATIPITPAFVGTGAHVVQIWYSTTAGSTHQNTECSSRGSCDRKTGMCDCFPGYDGEACARTACAGDDCCNGHGVCLSQKRIHADSSLTYATAWDAEKSYGCKCDAGYRGYDCTLHECPSSTDILGGCPGGAACSTYSNANENRDCSGRGLCNYEDGLCECFSGYHGEACEKQTILM